MGHIARFCPNKRSNDATVNVAQLNQVDTDAVNVAQVNRVAACIVDRPVADNSPISRVVRSTRPSTENTQPAGTDIVCSANREVEVEFPFNVFPRVAKINFVHDCGVNVKLSPLQYTDVFVNGLRCRALKESGAQLSLISQAVCDRVEVEVCGHIQLQGVVVDPIRAPLVNVCIKPCNEPDSINVADGIQVLCGVAPLTSTEYDVILTSEVIEDLSQLPVASVCNVQVCDDEVNECDDNHRLRGSAALL